MGGDDAVGWAVGDDGAVEADDAGEVNGDGVDFVGGEDDGDAGVVEVVEEVHYVVAGFDVDAGGGFVQQEEFGAADEGAGEEDALLLAAGELSDVAFGQAGDAQSLHHILGEFAFLFAEPGEEGVGHSAAHHYGFLYGDGEVPVDGFELGDVAGAAAACFGGSVVDAHFAGLDLGGAEYGAQQGGFAGAAGAEEADEVAGHNAEADFVEDAGAVVAGGYAAQFDYGSGVGVGAVEVFQFGWVQHTGLLRRGTGGTGLSGLAGRVIGDRRRGTGRQRRGLHPHCPGVRGRRRGRGA